MTLTRRFNAWHLLFLSVNGMLGSAWLFAPLYAAKLAGDGVVLAWLLGGAATILVALTFAEISSLLPIAGGSARFSELCFGPLAGFIVSFITWLSCVSMAPIEVQAVLQYSSTYFHGLMTTVQGVPVLTSFGLLWAAIILLGLAITNIVSFRGLVGFNFVLFIFKMAVIVITVFWFIKTRFVPEHFHIASENMNYWHGILSAIATGGIAFAFTGFKHGVELAEESKMPQWSIPLAIIGSVIVCLVLYLGLQIAFVGALSSTDLAGGWAHLHFANDLGPFVGLAGSLGLVWLLRLLFVDAAVSPLGAGLIFTTSTARLLYAMSRLGYLPQALAKVNNEKMPINAIAVNFFVGLFLFLPLPGWQNMVDFLVSAVVISYAMGPLVLIALRRHVPTVERPFRLPCATLLCGCAFYICNLMCYWTGWTTLSKLAIGIIIGLIILTFTAKRQVLSSLIHAHGYIWLLCYLAGLIVLSALGSFGGCGVIPFGWDFLWMGVFSLALFISAPYFIQKNIVHDFHMMKAML